MQKKTRVLEQIVAWGYFSTDFASVLVAGFIFAPGSESELKLELIRPHVAQKPVLRGEVGAHALRVRSVLREEV